jgi:hypothetical protein
LIQDWGQICKKVLRQRKAFEALRTHDAQLKEQEKSNTRESQGDRKGGKMKASDTRTSEEETTSQELVNQLKRK